MLYLPVTLLCLVLFLVKPLIYYSLIYCTNCIAVSLVLYSTSLLLVLKFPSLSTKCASLCTILLKFIGKLPSAFCAILLAQCTLVFISPSLKLSLSPPFAMQIGVSTLMIGNQLLATVFFLAITSYLGHLRNNTLSLGRLQKLSFGAWLRLWLKSLSCNRYSPNSMSRLHDHLRFGAIILTMFTFQPI